MVARHSCCIAFKDIATYLTALREFIQRLWTVDEYQMDSQQKDKNIQQAGFPDGHPL
jgi:hypothetical protein